MTKGQRAMAAWETAATYNSYTPTVSEAAELSDSSRGMVGWAKVVADDAPDLVPLVIVVGVMLVQAGRRNLDAEGNMRWDYGAVRNSADSPNCSSWGRMMEARLGPDR